MGLTPAMICEEGAMRGFATGLGGGIAKGAEPNRSLLMPLESVEPFVVAEIWWGDRLLAFGGGATEIR